MIKIVGLGPGDKEAITIGTLEVLKNSDKIYLRTEKHPTVEFLKQYGIKFETYDHKYEQGENFEQVYSSIADDLINKELKHKNIVYAVPGHPLVAEKSVNLLLKICEQKGIETEIFTAVSFIDVLMESLKIDPIEGMKIIDAFDIKIPNFG